MTGPAIPTHVHEFVCERIHTVEQLEVLILLHADRAETWTARSVAQTVSIDDGMASDVLEHLCAQGLLVVNPARGFRYAPRSEELASVVDETVASYRGSRLGMLQLISRCAMERIRTAHVRAFASAFLIRQTKKRDDT